MMLVAMEKMKNALYLCKVGHIRKTGNTTWLNQPQSAIMMISMCSCVFAVVFANSHGWANNILFNNKRRRGIYHNVSTLNVVIFTLENVMIGRSPPFTMTSSNQHLRVTGPLWWEFTGDQRMPFAKTSDAELWKAELQTGKIKRVWPPYTRFQRMCVFGRNTSEL